MQCTDYLTRTGTLTEPIKVATTNVSTMRVVVLSEDSQILQACGGASQPTDILPTHWGGLT